jgi:hypothetical protein
MLVELDLMVMVILLKMIIVIQRHPGCLNDAQIHLVPIKQPDNTLRTMCLINIFHLHLLFKSVSTLYRQLPNMSKNSARHQKKFEYAVQVLLKVPCISVPKAMILAQCMKKDVTSKTVCQAVRRHQD